MARYWIGDGGNWNDTAHWSTSSGGGGGASLPGGSDDVYFDLNSFTLASQTVVINIDNAYCKNFDCSTVTNTPTLNTPGLKSLLIYGDLISSASNPMNVVGQSGSGATYGMITFGGIVAQQCDFSGLNISWPVGATVGNPIIFNNSTGDTLLSDITAPYILVYGVMNFNNHNVNCYDIAFYNASTVNMGNGTYTLDISLRQGLSSNSSMTFWATSIVTGTPTVTFANGASIIIAQTGANPVLNKVIVNQNISLDGNMSIGTLTVAAGKTITFYSTFTYNVTTLTAHGSLGNLITFTNPLNSYTLNATNASCYYVAFAYCTATNTIYDYPGGVNNGHNVNIVFDIPTQYNAGTEGKLIIAPPRATTHNPILDASGITATRTYTFLDASGTVALLGTALTATRVPFANASGILVDDADLTFVTDTLSATKVAMSSLTSGRIPYATTVGLLIDSANLRFDGTYLIVNSIKDSALTSGRVTYASTNGLLTDNTNLQFDGTYLIANSIKDSALTSGRVPYATTNGLLTDSTNLQFDGTYLTANSIKDSALTPSRLVDSGTSGLLQSTYTVVTSIGSPGSNSNIPTEAAVRTSLGSVMSNPMTTIGDIIYSLNNSGTPTRLGNPVNGIENLLHISGIAGFVPSWEPAESALDYAVCSNDEVICNNDEIIYL